MGYAHYFYREQNLDEKMFAKSARDFKKLLPKFGERGIQLSAKKGVGVPVATKRKIAFNGVAGEEYEPFEITSDVFESARQSKDTGTVHFQFCSTNIRPYDFAVMVALVILKENLGEQIKVSSNGEAVDWKEAQDFCSTHLGYGKRFRLEKQ